MSLGLLGWLQLYGLRGYAVGPFSLSAFLGGEAGNSLARSRVSVPRVAAVQPHPWDPRVTG